MSQKKCLNNDDREFFYLVRDATFANPFSDERIELDLKISGVPPDVSDKERVENVTKKVNIRINNLEKEGLTNFNQFSGEDCTLMETVFLFDFFHQFITKFDKLIPEQIKAGDNPVKIPFSDDAITLLKKRGFSKEDACRYFALCYQLRRAFYFIDHALIGRSPCMKELRRNLWNNVFTHNIGLYNEYLWNRMEDFSTLILGETGTGKGTSALAIGRSGFIPFDEKNQVFIESFTKSFVSLNLSQFPETLIESELFGHKKGSFTGAMDDHKGAFDRCSPYGSIFLDEIGEASKPVQIKLLQILQERVFSPVGSHQKHRFRGRVIAATNRAIHEIRGDGILRDDFFYRLCSDIIVVPPLCQRIQEDPRELDHLLAHTIQLILGKPSSELAEMVRCVIDKQLGKEYHWHGNVRELEQCVRRVLLKCSYEGEHKSSVSRDLSSQIREGVDRGDIDAQYLITAYCSMLYQRHGTFEEVSRRTQLDRRTVKKYIQQWEKRDPGS